MRFPSDKPQSPATMTRLHLVTAISLLVLFASGLQLAFSQPVDDDIWQIDIDVNHSPKAQWQLQFDPGIAPKHRPKLTKWLSHHAQQLYRIGNRLPVPNLTINLYPAWSGVGPVPWAQIRRDPDGIDFYVRSDLKLSQFFHDWTASHEFSHLLIPYPGHLHIWFSEGLASYYQILLRARSGQTTTKQGLKDLLAGFQRGRKQAATMPEPLRQISPKMWREGAYMRVYWSGAAYFLNVDIALRQRAESPSSLDEVLKAFLVCCRQKPKYADALRLIAKFDELSQSDLFSLHYQRIIDSDQFPDVSASMQWLGIDTEQSKLTLKPNPPFEQRRAQLLSWQPD